jgi:hypothetical protein
MRDTAGRAYSFNTLMCGPLYENLNAAWGRSKAPESAPALSVSVIQGRYPSCRDQRGPRHIRGLAQCLPLRPVPWSARRNSESLWESQGTTAATGRDTTTTSRWGLCRPTVPDGASRRRLTPNQVWGLTKTDQEWSTALEEALTASRRGHLKHGTNAAYVQGCVCKDCREHERQRIAKNRV